MQAERRLSQKLINYWHSLKELCQDTPKEQDVSADLLSDIWENCFLIKQGVQGNPQGYRYSFVGERITQECIDSEPHIRRFLEHVLQLHDSAAIEAEKAIETNEPVVNEGTYLDEESQHYFVYRRCFVPLKDKSDELSIVLGGFRWKVSKNASETIH